MDNTNLEKGDKTALKRPNLVNPVLLFLIVGLPLLIAVFMALVQAWNGVSEASNAPQAAVEAQSPAPPATLQPRTDNRGSRNPAE